MTMEDSALARFHNAAVLWLVGQGPQATVILATCDILSQGRGDDRLARLAAHALDRELGGYEFERDVRAAAAEVDVELPQPESEELQLAAVRCMCRRLLREELGPRDLARWAHQVVGHTGHELAQPLVDLDDEYDLVEQGMVVGPDLRALDEQVRNEARRVG